MHVRVMHLNVSHLSKRLRYFFHGEGKFTNRAKTGLIRQVTNYHGFFIRRSDGHADLLCQRARSDAGHEAGDVLEGCGQPGRQVLQHQ